MKISLITSTYQSAETLEDTFRSVASQSYNDLEYIVVDGGSSDGTMDLLANYERLIDASTSEPDNGIYDALNKGIAMATGEVVGFIHSDDLLASPEVISTIAQAFEAKNVDAVYADLDYVDRDNTNKIIRRWRSRPFNPNAFYHGWMPPHPTFYLKRACYEKHGGYDVEFRQSADYELMLRMLLKHQVTAHYIPEVLVKMRMGGASNVSINNRWRANQEDARAWRKNGLKAPWYTRYLKPISKINQYFR